MIRPCPECGGKVESDFIRSKVRKLYTCPQCGAKLWLVQGTMIEKLVVAQVTQ